MIKGTIKVVSSQKDSGSNKSFNEVKQQKQLDKNVKGIQKDFSSLLMLFKKSAAIVGIAGTAIGLGALLRGQGVSKPLSETAGEGANRTLQQGTDLSRAINLPFSSYEEVVTGNGEKGILEIDNVTGKILDFMTIAEAQAKGLVDGTGELAAMLETSNSVFDELTADVDHIGDDVLLTKENFADIVPTSKEQRTLLDEITDSVETLDNTVSDSQTSAITILKNNNDIIRRQERLKEALTEARRQIRDGTPVDADLLDEFTTSETLSLIDDAAVGGGLKGPSTRINDEPTTVGTLPIPP